MRPLTNRQFQWLHYCVDMNQLLGPGAQKAHCFQPTHCLRCQVLGSMTQDSQYSRCLSPACHPISTYNGGSVKCTASCQPASSRGTHTQAEQKVPHGRRCNSVAQSTLHNFIAPQSGMVAVAGGRLHSVESLAQNLLLGQAKMLENIIKKMFVRQ